MVVDDWGRYEHATCCSKIVRCCAQCHCLLQHLLDMRMPVAWNSICLHVSAWFLDIQ